MLKELWYPYLQPIWKRIFCSILLSCFIAICMAIKADVENILPLDHFFVFTIVTFLEITVLCFFKWRIFTFITLTIMLSIGLISGIENFLFAQKIAQFDILLMKYPALQENIGRDRVAGLSDEEIEKDLDIIEGKALFYLTPQEIGKRLGRTEETLKTTMRYDLSQKIGDYEKARHYQLPREHIEMRIIYSKYLGVSASLLIKNDSIWDRIWPQCKVSETWIEAISNFIDRIIFSRYALASLLSTMSFFYVTLAVLCSFLSHWLPWEQRSKYFRVTCFIIACWITGSIAYFVLFPPQIYPYYGLRHFALITFVPPIIGGSLSYIYYRYIK